MHLVFKINFIQYLKNIIKYLNRSTSWTVVLSCIRRYKIIFDICEFSSNKGE